MIPEMYQQINLYQLLEGHSIIDRSKSIIACLAFSSYFDLLKFLLTWVCIGKRR